MRVVATDKEEALFVKEEVVSGFIFTEGDLEALVWLTAGGKMKWGYCTGEGSWLNWTSTI